jgi:site-specific recombinase XerD
MFLFQYYLGARITETLSLTIGDIVAPDGGIVDEVFFKRCNVKGKYAGSSQYVVQDAKDALRPWILQLHEMGYITKDARLFPAAGGKRLTRHAVYQIYDKVFRRAGLSGRLGTHSLRKAFGQKLMPELKYDVNKVRQALRQNSLDATINYLGEDKDVIREAMKKVL